MITLLLASALAQECRNDRFAPVCEPDGLYGGGCQCDSRGAGLRAGPWWAVVALVLWYKRARGRFPPRAERVRR